MSGAGTPEPGVLGRHVLADFWGCELPGSEQAWRSLVERAVDAVRATLLDLSIHTFDTGGVTVLAMLSESHLSAHTWPEHGYVAIDVFTCGKTTMPEVGIDVLRAALRPARETVKLVHRGDGVGGCER